jgi:glycosyltransferase involved in cell wall biosynthesis
VVPHEKIDIIIVSDYAHVEGGASQVALTSAIALAKNHSVTFLAGTGPVDAPLKDSTIQIECLNQPDILSDPNRLRAARRGLWNTAAQRRMIRLLDKRHARRTIVHVHSWTKSLSSSVIRAALDRHFSVVVTLHDYFAACPNGGFYHYPDNHICKLRGLSTACVLSNCDRRSYGHKLWRVTRQVVQRTLGGLPSGVRYFVATSDFSLSILKPYLPSDAVIRRIDNPVSLDKADPCLPHKQEQVITVGRLAAEKGSDIAAVAAKRAEIPITFIGDGELRQRIQSLNPDAHITGWVSTDEVNDHFRTARALVFPSVLYEVQPLAVLEAMAHGVPVVVPDTSAATELVEDGYTGLYFAGGQEEDLARKLSLLRDDDLVHTLGDQSYRRYWSAPRTVETHIANLESLYERMLFSSSGTN